MKKLLFLVLLISAFLTVLLFADDGKTEKKASEDTNRTQNGSAPEQDNELENEESTASGSRKTVLFSDRSPEKMTWNDAVNYCKNLSEKGSGGWHLPNIDELRKGIIGCAKTESGGECRVSEKNGCLSSECKNPKGSCSCERIAKGSFYSANCDEDNIALWSSSTLSDNPDSAWGIVYYSAMVGSNKKSGKFYARCVKEAVLRDDGTVLSEKPVIMGALNRCTIDSYVRKSVGKIGQCYENGLAKDKKLAGGVVINFIISASGDVSSAKVQRTTMGNAEVENCVAGVIKKIKFPAPRGGGIVIVNYPFVFKPEKK
ncbi:TonB family protein [bacterium]|nr:TonB family protein [bacterium]